MMADCMPVLLAHQGGSVVGIAHAGWRGLAAGVIEATLDAMAVAPQKITAWLGPAIGPRVYEVGDEVRVAFAGHEAAFTPTRPGHWLLDLYAVARARLARKGVRAIDGAGFCTYSDQERFFSYRRDRDSARMAALIWLA
jgi:YfiH family protein